MTTMIQDALEAYGLNQNEIKVFLALVDIGGGFARDLIDSTKLHKNIVYDNLYKLQEKGLVSEIIIESKKYFQCESPQAIQEFITQKKKKFNTYDQAIQELQEDIQQKKQLPQKTSTRMYTGISGIKQIFSEEIEIGEDYLHIGAPKESVELLGVHFWKNFIRKQEEKNIRGKILFNESLRTYANSIHHELNNIRFLEEHFEPLTEICIYANQVAIIVWSQEPIGTVIENKDVADSYKKYFEILWNQARK